MQNRRILIIGGNGFIGQNLVRFLSENTEAQISVLDRNTPPKPMDGVEYINGDFFNEAQIKEAVSDKDVIFHALSTISPSDSNDNYLRGYSMDLIQTIKLCDLLRERNVRLIFLSSGGTVYGEQVLQPIPEEAPLNPINHYGALKGAIETHLRVQNKQFGTNFLTARISNPYGPGQDYHKGVGLVDAVLRCGIEERTLEIWGNGTTVRDYIRIQDVCSMLTALVDYEGPWDTFNIATGCGHSQNDLIDIARTIIPSLKVEYLHGRSIDVAEVILNPKKILSVWNSVPEKLEQGVVEYFEYLTSQS